jgi:hypothetical protein
VRLADGGRFCASPRRRQPRSSNRALQLDPGIRPAHHRHHHQAAHTTNHKRLRRDLTKGKGVEIQRLASLVPRAGFARVSSGRLSIHSSIRPVCEAGWVAPRKKRLSGLVRDRSFLAGRHEDLLQHDTLHPRYAPGLVELQERFRAESDPPLRRRLSLRFERMVRETETEQIERALRELPIRPAQPAPRSGDALLARVLKNTFVPAKHETLLRGEPLPAVCPIKGSERVWRELGIIQARYVLVCSYPDYAARQFGASVEHLRRLFSSEFRTLVEALRSGKLPPRLRDAELD